MEPGHEGRVGDLVLFPLLPGRGRVKHHLEQVKVAEEPEGGAPPDVDVPAVDDVQALAVVERLRVGEDVVHLPLDFHRGHAHQLLRCVVFHHGSSAFQRVPDDKKEICFSQALFLDDFTVVFRTLLQASTMSQTIPDIHGYSQIFPVSEGMPL